MHLSQLIFALPLLAAACSVNSDDDKAKVSVGGIEIDANGDKALVSIGGEKGLKIDTDGFKATVEIPGMNLGGKGFDIDGMKLYPGSTIKGMRVDARDKDGDKNTTIVVTFTSPAAPDVVLAFAEKEADREGYAVGRSGRGLTGGDGSNKGIAYVVDAEGSGTRGTVTLTDKDRK